MIKDVVLAKPGLIVPYLTVNRRALPDLIMAQLID